MIKLSKKNVKKIPESSGVYMYLDENKNINYIGKAVNLRNRIKSYFYNTSTGKTKIMLDKSKYLDFIETNSDFEAILLEAKLIKKHKPEYNIELKDDKHPLYIKITDDEYPRVTTARKSDTKNAKALYGPFPSSNAVYSVLKNLRKSFPYATHVPTKRKCIYSQMGLCDPCPSFIENLKSEKLNFVYKKEYKGNIRLLKGVLSGRITYVRENMIKKMEKLSIEQKFEEAAKIKKQIDNLDYITRPVFDIGEYLKDPNLKEEIREKETAELEKIIKSIARYRGKMTRIECFDVAHLKGSAATASMVTFIGGEAEKKYYRHFKVKQEKKQSDVDSLKEIAERRVKHFEDWGRPDMIIVDGGRAQVGVFMTVMRLHGIFVIGVAKREEKLVIPVETRGVVKFREKKLPRGNAKNLVQRLRDEAHRFARRYHHKLLQKDLLQTA